MGQYEKNCTGTSFMAYIEIGWHTMECYIFARTFIWYWTWITLFGYILIGHPHH